jgi:uncharacterized protein (TIGR04255 family)
MPFPESPRVIYQKNPLVEVICQLRFPAILRIAAEVPSGFQERIRTIYPCYNQKPVMPLLPAGLPVQVVNAIQQVAGSGRAEFVHEFAAEDETWAATLAPSFLALKTTEYRRWEDFQNRLRYLFDALVDMYQPHYFERVGLRYVDVIQRSHLGLSDRPWRDLLQPHIAAELAATGIVDNVLHVARQALVSLGDTQGQVRIRHGFSQAEPTNEQCYMIDSDFFVERRVEKENALDTLSQFNRRAGRLFRWCIQTPVHDALGAEPT